MSTILNFPNSFVQDFATLSLRDNLQTLIDFIDRQPYGLLTVDAPWRPNRLIMKDLAKQTQHSALFWTNLTSLAASALHLEVLPDGFLIGTKPVRDTEHMAVLNLRNQSECFRSCMEYHGGTFINGYPECYGYRRS